MPTQHLGDCPNLTDQVLNRLRDMELPRYSWDLKSHLRGAGEFHVHFGVRYRERGYDPMAERKCLQIVRQERDDLPVGADSKASQVKADVLFGDADLYHGALNTVGDSEQAVVLVCDVERMEFVEPRAVHAGSKRLGHAYDPTSLSRQILDVPLVGLPCITSNRATIDVFASVWVGAPEVLSENGELGVSLPLGRGKSRHDMIQTGAEVVHDVTDDERQVFVRLIRQLGPVHPDTGIGIGVKITDGRVSVAALIGSQLILEFCQVLFCSPDLPRPRAFSIQA